MDMLKYNKEGIWGQWQVRNSQADGAGGICRQC